MSDHTEFFCCTDPGFMSYYSSAGIICFPPNGGYAMNQNIVIIGGDLRMKYTAERLGRDHGCTLCGFEAGEASVPADGKYDAAVLPIFTGGYEQIRCPFANRTYDISILPLVVKKGGTVFAGRVFPALEKLCSENGFELYDYLLREELAVRNAQLTAEGALAAAIRETSYSLHGANVTILGFGRIGKLCARYFSAVGSVTVVAARKASDIAWAESLGYSAVSFMDEAALVSALAKADIILNTAPAKVLTSERAASVRSDALLIELASENCTEGTPHFRVVNAGGLPAKTAPETAGRIIADTIENILTERSIKNGGT